MGTSLSNISGQTPIQGDTLIKHFEQSHERDIKNENQTSLRDGVIQIATAVGIACSMPLAGPAILLAKLKQKLTKKIKREHCEKSVEIAVETMQQKIEAERFNVVQKTVKTFGGIEGREKAEDVNAGENSKHIVQVAAASLVQGIEDKLGDPVVEQERAVRQILLTLSRRSRDDPKVGKQPLSDQQITKWKEFLNSDSVKKFKFEDLPKSAKDFSKFETSEFGIALKKAGLLEDVKTLSNKDLKEIHDTKELNVPLEKREAEVKKFQASLENLLRLSQNKDSDPAISNVEVTEAFREALSSPVYVALQNDSSLSSIKLLHHLGHNIWNKVHSLDSYRDVGQKIVDRAEGIKDERSNPKTQTELKEDIPHDGKKLADRLETTYEKMKKVLCTDVGLVGKVSYALFHVKETFTAGLSSEGGALRAIAGTVGLDVYDPLLFNLPSVQGTNTYETGQQVRNCYGGCPTIGDTKIAPEFMAMLKGMENNQLALEQDEDLGMMCSISSLQNLHRKEGEGPRTTTLILAAEQFPLSLQVTVFSKDSDLYLLKDVRWEDPEQFGKVMMEELTRSFDPNEKGHGFYFPGSLKTWEPSFKKVIEDANNHFTELKKYNPKYYESLGKEELQGAYIEYVYTLLDSRIELQSLKTLENRGLSNIILIILKTCKENVDRGAMENLKYLYYKLAEGIDQIALYLGCAFGRALQVRDRLPLPHRMINILNLFRIVPQETVKNVQEKYADEFGFGKSEYIPCLAEKEAKEQVK